MCFQIKVAYQWPIQQILKDLCQDISLQSSKYRVKNQFLTMEQEWIRLAFSSKLDAGRQ